MTHQDRRSEPEKSSESMFDLNVMTCRTIETRTSSVQRASTPCQTEAPASHQRKSYDKPTTVTCTYTPPLQPCEVPATVMVALSLSLLVFFMLTKDKGPCEKATVMVCLNSLKNISRGFFCVIFNPYMIACI